MKRILPFFLVVFFVSISATGQNNTFNLNDTEVKSFQELSIANSNSSGFQNAQRFRELFINPVLQKTDIVRINDTISLDLFDKKQYKACIDKFSVDINGTITIRARIAGYMYGSCIITTFKNESYLIVDIPENNEQFKSSYNHQTKKYYLLQFDRSRLDVIEGAPALTPPVHNRQNEIRASVPDSSVYGNKKKIDRVQSIAEGENQKNNTVALQEVKDPSLISTLKSQSFNTKGSAGNVVKGTNPDIDSAASDLPDATLDTYAVYGGIYNFAGGTDADNDQYYETYSFYIGIDGDAVPGPVTIYMKIICTTTGLSWWSSESFIITGTETDYRYFLFDQTSFLGITGNTNLDFTVEIWNAAKTTMLASDASVSGEPVYADKIMESNFSVYGSIDNFAGGIDADDDGYFETYSFNIGINGDVNPGPSTVYMRIVCTTTGASWWSSESFTITGTETDYRYFLFDQTNFPDITGNTNLDFTVELWNTSKTSILASDASVTGEPVYADFVQPQGPPETITLMIVYTPAAAEWAISNETNINNTIGSLMSMAQLALDNSNSLITIDLVHSAQVDYSELNSEDDLNNLTGMDDGYMDNIHALRNTYEADMVVLLEVTEDVGGIGWLLTDVAGEQELAFSLTRVQQASGSYTTIHEMGHNMGCHHHKLQNSQPGPGLFPYSAGWRWTGADNGNYCSVMTYTSGSYFEDGITHTRVPYFSNPTLQYQGLPTGDVADADNARSLREIRSVIADYRPLTSPSLSVSPATLSIGYESGSTGNLSITSNTSWSVSDDASWLSVSPASGSNNGTVTITAGSANPSSTASRLATVTVSGSGVSSKMVIVKQESLPALSISPLPLPVIDNPAGSSINFSITSNTDWTVSDDASWLSVSPAGGSNNGTVTVTADSANQSATATRSATITVSGTGISSQTLTVTQAASAVLTISPSSVSIGYASGSWGSFSITSNTSWSLSDDASWLTVSPVNGANDGTVTVTASSANPSTTSTRSATVTVSGTGLSAQSVTVTQNPASYLNVEPASRAVSYSAGSATFGVSSNDIWTITENSDWIACTKSNETELLVNYAENVSSVQRSAEIAVSIPDTDPVVISIIQEGGIPSGINHLFENTKIKIYPNPASSRLFIQTGFDINAEVTISLYDDLGNLLYTKKLKKMLTDEPVEIDMSSFSYGIYILQLNNFNAIKIEKIIKQ